MRRAAGAALEASGLARSAGEVELSILLADDARIRELNRRYLDRDRPTNVLAFPRPADGDDAASPPGAPLLLGDVVLAYETVAAEAKAQEKALCDHVSHLVVHGVLHCAGHDHDVESRAVEMERLETSILAGLGIDDPYAMSSAADTWR